MSWKTNHKTGKKFKPHGKGVDAGTFSHMGSQDKKRKQKRETNWTEVKTVKDLNDRTDLTFVSDSQDTEDLKQRFDPSGEFDSFFVKVGEGDYDEVWGMENIVPWLHKTVYRLL